ncbi:MAG: hypothetical protein ACHBN1_12265 [Heteroscytonema crispum UTEX LB 1556]
MPHLREAAAIAIAVYGQSDRAFNPSVLWVSRHESKRLPQSLIPLASEIREKLQKNFLN